MNDINEELLNISKLKEIVDGQIPGPDIDPHAAPADPDELSSLNFSSDLEEFHGSKLQNDINTTLTNRMANRSLSDSASAAYLAGITEQNLDATHLSLSLKLDKQMSNNDATAFVGGAGNPNTGKTNLVALLAELRSTTVDDLLVISNSRSWPRTDIVVTSAHDLAVTCIENRDRPKFVFIDEGSTHFDARTQSREVAVQFTPLAKRFAKINVDVFATVGHTGKDLHPELKRLLTLSFFKHSKKEVDFFQNWPADSDSPADRLFGGLVEDLEPATQEPDPDDAAPWKWDLDPDLFGKDLSWENLLKTLKN